MVVTKIVFIQKGTKIMDKVKESLDAYMQIENKTKKEKEDLERRLQVIEEESSILKAKTSADKRVALTNILLAIGETAKNEKVREFALRSINFVSIESTEKEIFNLIECDVDKLDIGDKFSGWTPSFRINIFDGYENVLSVSGDMSGTITEIELEIRHRAWPLNRAN